MNRNSGAPPKRTPAGPNDFLVKRLIGGGAPRQEGGKKAWLETRIARPDAALRLFCFPYAGGGASIYRDWGSRLPASIEVTAIQLPGRENRIHDRLVDNFLSLLRALTDVMLAELDDRPIAFFGHSLGSLVAFELARNLQRERRDLELRRLFLSGSFHPDRYADAMQNQFKSVARSPITDEDALEFARTMNALPKQILEDPAVLRTALSGLRADLAVLKSYPQARGNLLNCPITVLAGDDDPIAPPDEGESWQSATTGPFEVVSVSGDHFFIDSRRDEVLRIVSEKLTQDS